MTFTQIHERLRQALIRRIQDGALSVSLLSKRTGLAQAHVSNFLRKRRGLSKEAMDRVLASQHMKVEDLLPSLGARGKLPDNRETSCVAVVSHKSALFDPVIYRSATLDTFALPSGILQSLRAHPSPHREAWRRLIAIRVSPADAEGMEPVLTPDAFAIIDRHDNSLLRYRPPHGSIYAVRNGTRLVLRYVDLHSPGLVLRLHNAAPSELLEVERGQKPEDLIVGRVVSVLNQT